ncbi:MAG: alpha/beta fold hydrolase [Rubrobacteraceae bacterium]
MTAVVLVHGGSRDADVWDKVRPELEASGHRVICPSLPDAAASTFHAHVETVCREVEGYDLTDFVLVGHSYGGLVVTVAGTRMADKTATLVYLDSAYPQIGKSLLDAIEECGLNPADFGVDTDPPFVTPLEFDLAIWKKIPKAYVRALRSEFGPVSRLAGERATQHAKDAHWSSFEIDSVHNMMQDKPLETCALLERIISQAAWRTTSGNR